ncbi:arsenate reductase ArsC [Flavobacterium sp.]|uniref:arsenate reductase ArsC n=1 Tax=Flavobacterium sp. TaxID=239 RepID=UPI00286A53DF|nr:arsenate reductase ArsC [Flavobacterium sp.]
MKNVLVLCTGNSCRSQMAQGYLESLTDKSKVKIYSAGTNNQPINQRAIDIMKEDDIDISNNTSNNVNEYLDVDFDFVITVCDNAKENCPIFPSKAVKIHYDFPDPAATEGSEDEIYFQFLTVREMIKMFCEDFVEENL